MFHTQKDNSFTALSSLTVGEVASICCILNTCDNRLKRRLLELGFVEGAQIKVLAKSLLNDVILVQILNYTISIRKDIAKSIVIKGRSNGWWDIACWQSKYRQINAF